MADRKSPGDEHPPQNTDPRRSSNPPTAGSKTSSKVENTPKSSPNAAIPPEKLNAENDK
jgi:hypothetical protein